MVPSAGSPGSHPGDSLEAPHSPRLLELAVVLFGFSPGIISGQINEDFCGFKDRTYYFLKNMPWEPSASNSRPGAGVSRWPGRGRGWHCCPLLVDMRMVTAVKGAWFPEHRSPPTRQRLRCGRWGFSGALDSCSDSLLDTRVHSSGGTGTRFRLVLGSRFPYCIPGLKY